MSLFHRDARLDALEKIIGEPLSRPFGGLKPDHSAPLQQSVVWASMNLRAATESSMPLDVFRYVDGATVEAPKPQVLKQPSEYMDGHFSTNAEWRYAGRMALDGHGNNWGEKVGRDGNGQPLRIELVPPEEVSCRIKGTRIVEVKFGRTVMDPANVWHERQYLLPGLPIGLTAFGFAALAVETSSAARQFAAQWFGNSAIPAAHFKNTEKALKPGEPELLKARYERTVRNGGLLVTGNDWTYSPIQAKAAESGFIEAMGYANLDLVRFMGVRADMVHVPIEGSSSITYQNLTQANLQFLVQFMGAALTSREDAYSTLVPSPRFVKHNQAAWLRMDPLTQAQLIQTRIASRTMTPDRALDLLDEMPLSEADYAQFDRLFGNPNKQTPQKEAVA